MDEEFGFWYIFIDEVQLGLEGKEFHKLVAVEGHITHGGRLLCKESMEILKNQVKKKYEAQTITDKPMKVRLERKKICPECQRLYKKNGHSAYTAWVEGKPKIPATREVISKHVVP